LPVIRFAVLGRLLVGDEQRPVEVGRRRERCLLGVLLLEAGAAVPADRLVSLLWDDDPPAAARASLHSHVARLRSALAGLPLRLARTADGYTAEVDPDLVDAHRFRTLVEHARAEGDPSRRIGMLRGALALWRGPILVGDASDRLRDRIGAPLEELRLTATELVIDAELARGRHAETIGELLALTAEHPTRESLAGKLMLAMYRCGRHAEALDFYRAFTDRLAAELGADPGAELRQLHTAILQHAPHLTAGGSHTPVARPVLLPPGPADFAGRAGEMERLRAVLGDSGLVLVTGPGGVGKSALVVHASHRLQEHFPDGVLFAELHGTQPAPAEPAGVLGRFLRALGVPGGTVPSGLDERVDLYRSLLAGRRVLVVLDDARNLGQLAPLLPAAPTCAALVTSRRRLGGLACTDRISLTVFDPGEATALLAGICGRPRVTAEPEAAATIAALCGYLPLAIRVAGARLAVRAHWPLHRLARRLSAEHSRLDELTTEDLAVRATFAISYRDVGAEGRRVLRRLALLDAPDFPAWVAAPLLGVPYDRAEDLVEGLVDSYLLEAAGSMRYGFHDLIRLFARAEAEAEDDERQRRHAVTEALTCWLRLAEAAAARLPYRLLSPMPGGGALPYEQMAGLVEDPFAWLAAERTALVAAVRQAAASGLDELAWRLADAARDLFDQRDHSDDLITTHRAALAACEAAGNRLGLAAMRYGLACRAGADEELGLDPSLAMAEQARAGFAALGLPGAEVDAMVLAASLHRRRGDLATARELLEESTGRAARAGNAATEAASWRSLGVLHREQHNYDEALRCFTASLRLAQRHDLPDVEAFAHRGLGVVHRERGDFDASEAAFESALGRYEDLGQPSGEATALLDLGQLQTRRGDPRAAATLRRALAIFARDGISLGYAVALRALGELELAGGRPEAATTHLQASLAMWRTLREPYGTALCLSALGRAYQLSGDAAQAAEAWTEARDHYLEIGNESEADRLAALLRAQ
jgi:DNA-binding SARP family transcriptional activator/tetratricopeptide (TPR) repeat protein